MTKDDTQKLRSCIGVLDFYEKPLHESLQDGDQTRDPPAVMLLRAFTFGRATLKAMIGVADQGDEECSVCLPTLCRPFYELTVRVLWATRQPDGWQRLQAHYANEEKKWAIRAVEIRSWAGYAQPVLDNVVSVLGRTDAKGRCYKLAPDMAETLVQVEQHDIDCGINTGEKGFALFQYANLWQMMCGTAHAHVVRIARSPEGHMLIAVNGAVVATFALLRATAVVTAPDEKGLKETVELMGQKIIGILKGEIDLGLDEIVFTRVPPDPA